MVVETKYSFNVVLLAMNFGFKHLHLHGNAEDTVEELLNIGDPPTAALQAKLTQAHDLLLLYFDSRTISFAPWEDNFLAHSIAHFGVYKSFCWPYPHLLLLIALTCILEGKGNNGLGSCTLRTQSQLTLLQ